MAIAAINAPFILVDGLVWGSLCLFLANRNRQRKGFFPWKLHPAIWFIIGFVLGLIGVALCGIARATTKPPVNTFPGYGPYGGVGPPPGTPWQAPPPGTAVPSAGHYPGSYPAAYPGGAPSYPGAAPSYPGEAPSYPGAPPSPPPGAPGTAGPPAAWYPDPSGRNELRYWDGTQWTAHASNSGTTSTDPL